MKKEDINKSRFCLQYDDHAKVISNILCSMMEHQSLVDLAIRCGNNTIHVHKCVLAANSNYFKDQLEKNAETEQIIINGLDFFVVKALIEFMYCGETNVVEESMKYFIAAAKFFQIRGVQSIAQDTSHYNPDDVPQIPLPTFLTKKPKYSNTYLPFNNPNMPSAIDRTPISLEHPYHRRLKRKYMRTEAEKACAKEAAASRLALEALQKELANTSQVSSFVIEESCTETTVENFIPHTEDAYIDNMGHISNVPLQVVNYSELAPSVLAGNSQMKTPGGHFAMGASDQEAVNPTTEKLKHILGTDNLPNNVEIMFKTSEGNFVSVTEEVLANITRGSLQYQLVDENGHASELQEVQVSDKLPLIESNPQVIDSYLVNDAPENLIKKNAATNSNAVFIPLNEGVNEQQKITINDDYGGMIQECPSEGYPTEVFVKQNDIKNKLNVTPKEPSFSTRQFEGFEEDNGPVYISNCDPLSEACGIAEKDENDKLKESASKADNASEGASGQEEDSKMHVKKFKLVKSFIEMANEECETIKIDVSPRKTRSCKVSDATTDADKENLINKFFEDCSDKSKKYLSVKKKTK